jgi:hypothetical protein
MYIPYTHSIGRGGEGGKMMRKRNREKKGDK